MSAKANKCTTRSREVASRFLQTAVIVDDQARLEGRPGSVVSPGRKKRSRSKRKTELAEKGPGAATHDLDAKLLIDSFAEIGVVCAVLKPALSSSLSNNKKAIDSIETLSVRMDKATKRADIVIVDWNIPDEQKAGDNAKLLMEEILKTDVSSQDSRRDDHSRRLRLIAIYTGDEDLESITAEIKPLLKKLDLGELAESNYNLKAGPVTITVYGKGKPIIQSVDAERRVGEKELPSRLRDEFAEMTKGLLANAALESLSAIRTNTHRLLRRFNRTLDPAFIAHRAMMQPPEEAEQHPVPLIASEIEGVLADDAQITELVGLDAVAGWLDGVDPSMDGLEKFDMDGAAFKRELLSLLEHGLEQAAVHSQYPQWARFLKKLKNSRERQVAGTITRILDCDGSKTDMRFAMLTSLRSRYEAPPPVLRLGSIVVTERDGYLFCIQPLCDSVRLDEPRKFPFLKLRQRSDSSNRAFDLVVKDGSDLLRLAVSRKAFDICVMSMDPNPDSKSVEGQRTEDGWEFRRTGSDSPVRWLADLKPEFAQRILNEFVGDLARVGLTESEWLRRMARK